MWELSLIPFITAHHKTDINMPSINGDFYYLYYYILIFSKK